MVWPKMHPLTTLSILPTPENIWLCSHGVYFWTFFVGLCVGMWHQNDKLAVCDEEQESFRFLYATQLNHINSLKWIVLFLTAAYVIYLKSMTLVVRNHGQVFEVVLWDNWTDSVNIIHIQYPQVTAELFTKYELLNQHSSRIRQLRGGCSSAACIIVCVLHEQHSWGFLIQHWLILCPGVLIIDMHETGCVCEMP